VQIMNEMSSQRLANLGILSNRIRFLCTNISYVFSSSILNKENNINTI
jgi:hypothetical protein